LFTAFKITMLKQTFLTSATIFACAMPALADKASLSRQAALEQLGQTLFFDPGLSSPAGQSCATCHAVGAAFADPDRSLPVSRGALPGRVGSRNSQTAMYAQFSPEFHFDKEEEHYVGGQFWDGRAATLEEQAKGPLLDPLEMANPDKASVVDKVRRAAYAADFDTAFGLGALADTDQAFERIAQAIAAFERTRQFAPFTSKYDAYLAGKAKLTAQEKRGLRLFEDEKKGNCAACHPSQQGPDGAPPLFTDFTYDNLGVPRNPHNPFYKLPPELNPAGANFVDPGLGGALNEREEDGKFKVPTLRNIALTAPYMHNGYFTTLRGSVVFYNDRDKKPRCKSGWVSEAEALKHQCWPAPEVAANVNDEELGDLGLSEREIDDIVAFMHTLTDGWQPPPRRR
jgi:cytochrome c peroxidase